MPPGSTPPGGAGGKRCSGDGGLAGCDAVDGVEQALSSAMGLHPYQHAAGGVGIEHRVLAGALGPFEWVGGQGHFGRAQAAFLGVAPGWT